MYFFPLIFDLKKVKHKKSHITHRIFSNLFLSFHCGLQFARPDGNQHLAGGVFTDLEEVFRYQNPL